MTTQGLSPRPRTVCSGCTSRWPTRSLGSGRPARCWRSMSYARPNSVSPRPFWPVGNQAAAGSQRSPALSSPRSSGALIPPAVSTGRNHQADGSTQARARFAMTSCDQKPFPRSPGRGAWHRARGIHPSRRGCSGRVTRSFEPEPKGSIPWGPLLRDDRSGLVSSACGRCLLSARDSERHVRCSVSEGRGRSDVAATEETPTRRRRTLSRTRRWRRPHRLQCAPARRSRRPRGRPSREGTRVRPSSPCAAETIEIDSLDEDRVFVAKGALDLVKGVLFVVGHRHDRFLLSFPAGRAAADRPGSDMGPAHGIAMATGLLGPGRCVLQTWRSRPLVRTVRPPRWTRTTRSG